MLSLPLVAHDAPLGSLNLYARSSGAFAENALYTAHVSAEPLALALANARAYDVALSEVLVLPRNLLLARLPRVPGVDLAVRYVPAGAGDNVGGDWYDAFELPDGRFAVTIGDVAGHGLTAASVMGQLRNGLRAYTVAGQAPSECLKNLSQLLTLVEPDAMATVCHLLIDSMPMGAERRCAGRALGTFRHSSLRPVRHHA